MDDPDHFLAHAARCRKIAKISADPFAKETWMKLAADWLTLAELLEAPRKPQRGRARAPNGQNKIRAELVR